MAMPPIHYGTFKSFVQSIISLIFILRTIALQLGNTKLVSLLFRLFYILSNCKFHSCNCTVHTAKLNTKDWANPRCKVTEQLQNFAFGGNPTSSVVNCNVQAN